MLRDLSGRPLGETREFGACKRSVPTKISLAILMEETGARGPGTGSAWLWQRWRGSELRRGVDEGAHVGVANETEGTGFGAEQTWEAGRGEGGAKTKADL